ncbi:MAG TPA: GTP 3',8-cyclase MoaA [Phaeodactylibacter sp.]|nr:GTP 3',8-cyclase MoaA [Phaeodactylibacter sp.]
MTDRQGRTIDYLRIALTDRCNLRCTYCMPEQGIRYVARDELMSYEELLRLVRLLKQHGFTKLRITGGEPFLRKDVMSFLSALREPEYHIPRIRITTNGTLILPRLEELKRLDITHINLSLDSLRPERFADITRRDNYQEVITALHRMLELGFHLKINMVVMADKNADEIADMARLAEEHPLEIRFIEEMPFNGRGQRLPESPWNHQRILEELQQHFPQLHSLPKGPHATAERYSAPGFRGSIGIIAAWSRTFCGSCNRLRLTPQGVLRTCLYDKGTFNLRDMMRAGATDRQILYAIQQALQNRAPDGFESEKRSASSQTESMAQIGG